MARPQDEPENAETDSLAEWRPWDTEPPASDEEDLEWDKGEMALLIVQYLESVGCVDAARQVEKETGIEDTSLTMKAVKKCILEGNWEQLETILDKPNVFRSPQDEMTARFILYQQYYLELIHAGKTTEALQALQTKLAPCCSVPERLRRLSMLMMCQSAAELERRTKWKGLESRRQVLRAAQNYVSPSLLLPEKRLQLLVNQAVQYQKEKQNFPFVKQKEISLLEDLHYDPQRIPTKTSRVLTHHKDEVWFVQFSHNGKLLATASKDKSVVVWDMEKLLASPKSDTESAILYDLSDSTSPLGCFAWSPDDSLLCCGYNKTIRIFRASDGSCVETLENHTNKVTACGWLTKNSSFVTASHDERILFWEKLCWEESMVSWHQTSFIATGFRIADMGTSREGDFIVTVCFDNSIHVYNAATQEEMFSMSEGSDVTCLCLSMDSNHLLVNLSTENTNPVIHEWSLAEKKIVRKYCVQGHSRFLIRSCFGGNDRIVVSGSGENGVFLWYRSTGELVARLTDHQGTVNCVSWNPLNPFMFASASDDQTVRIWEGRPVDVKQSSIDGDVTMSAPPAEPDACGNSTK